VTSHRSVEFSSNFNEGNGRCRSRNFSSVRIRELRIKGNLRAELRANVEVKDSSTGNALGG